MTKNSQLRKRFVAFLATFFMAIQFSSRAEPISGVDVLGISRQIVLVLCDSWNSTNGLLRRYELTEAGWKIAGSAVPVSLGRNGLAWGRGGFPPRDGRQKGKGTAAVPPGFFVFPTSLEK